ncbi:P-loop containing nucleoside triphosphate hydrolase protein [Agrocybe pediades]|nr:P-loop containing nucleoside triphosphate hydrolase protein [Agrocybe pediades]
MPKRHHQEEIEEEDDYQDSPTTQKRARMVPSSDEEEDQRQTRPRREAVVNGKGKGKARVLDEEEVISEDDEDEVQNTQDILRKHQATQNMTDEEFEMAYAARVQAQISNRRVGPGSVGDMGIIEYIEMHQFMCHKYLKFSFGPQINFIIGHNGSGKSAVLSAITVALGGKAASTGRGNGLKSFIREGQSVSEVTIHIKNQGEEAYKPQDYGKTIVITRRFTKEGSSTWKIKSKDGKVISTKKDELSAICDHMNIQVDNPLTVLTQDSARQFLSASNPQDKYRFFLRGTQLQQLSEEYELCLSNITQTAKVLSVKKEALPDLRDRYLEVKARYEEAQRARDQKKKVDALKRELAWSHVAAKQAELEEKVEDAAKMARRIPKIEEGVQSLRTVIENASAEVEQLEEEFNQVESADHLVTRKTELQDKIRANKVKLSTFNNDLKTMDHSMATINRQIEGLENSLQDEARRMASNTQAKHEETQRQIAKVKEDISRLEAQINTIISERKTKGAEADTLKAEGGQLEEQKKQLQIDIDNANNMIKSAGQSAQDALVPYGKNIKGVLEKIRGMRWYGDMPLGPLGVHVKARDPQTWGELLRNQLAHLLCAFAVTDGRDRAQLKKLLTDSGNQRTLIIIYEKDLFDFSRGEPRQGLLTVLRALEINDDYVLRILINQAHIESQILAPTRREAEGILRHDLRGGGQAFTLDKMAVRVFPDGGVSCNTLNFRPMSGPLGLLLTGRDSAADISYHTTARDEAKRQYDEIHSRSEHLRSQYMNLRFQIEAMNKDEERLQRELRSAKNALSRIQQQANDDLPVGLAGLEAAKKEAEDERDDLKNQFAAVMNSKVALDNEQKELHDQLNEIKSSLNRHEEGRRGIAKKIEDAVEVRMKAQNDMKYMEDKLKEERKKVESAERTVSVVQQEFENWTEKAKEYCEEVPNPRKTEEVQRHLDSLQKALKEREKQSQR